MDTAQTTTVHGMDAVYYLTKDFKRARDFYEGALGLQPAWEDSTEFGDWVEYELADGNTFGLGYLRDAPFNPSGGVMFAVSDVADAQQRAKQAGATVVFDVLDTPVCTMTWCVDTEGNSFCLHKLRT